LIGCISKFTRFVRSYFSLRSARRRFFLSSLDRICPASTKRLGCGMHEKLGQQQQQQQQ